MVDETEAHERQSEDEQANGGDGGGHRGAVRAAAIAAATGATAFAAKKALSGRDRSREGRQKTGGDDGGDESTVGAMLVSGWSAAKDSLLPFAEDAAGAAGEWVAHNGPDLVRETLVPRFIRGFEKARTSSEDE
jgi:hypothetical protein